MWFYYIMSNLKNGRKCLEKMVEPTMLMVLKINPKYRNSNVKRDSNKMVIKNIETSLASLNHPTPVHSAS